MKKMPVFCHRNCNGHLIGCVTEEFAETTRMLKGLTALTLSFLSTESAYCQPGTYFRRWLENWGLPMGPLTQRSMFDKSPETSFARLSSWTRSKETHSIEVRLCKHYNKHKKNEP